MVLIRIQRPLPSAVDDVERLEGELARCGARDAHVTPGGELSVLVVARTAHEACALVDDLLSRALERA